MSLTPSAEAQHYWDNAPDDMLHLDRERHMKELRPWFEELARDAARLMTPRAWLDYGVGGGAGCALAKEYGFHVIGVDISKRACVPGGVALITPDRLSSLRDGGAGVVTCTSVLQHADNTAQAVAIVAELARLCATPSLGLLQIRYDTSTTNDCSEPYALVAADRHAWSLTDFNALLVGLGWRVSAPVLETHRWYAWYRVSR